MLEEENGNQKGHSWINESKASMIEVLVSQLDLCKVRHGIEFVKDGYGGASQGRAICPDDDQDIVKVVQEVHTISCIAVQVSLRVLGVFWCPAWLRSSAFWMVLVASALNSLVSGPFVGLLKMQRGQAGVWPFLFPQSARTDHMEWGGPGPYQARRLALCAALRTI